MAIWHASKGRIVQHQRWASRCFLLLISPLVFRVVSGGLIVTGWESPPAYCLNAWLSWLVPLTIYEVWTRWSLVIRGHQVPQVETPNLTQEATV
jgi:hypothetical protein